MKKLLGATPSGIISTVYLEIEILQELTKSEQTDGNKDSGYLTILDSITGRAMLVIQFGICPQESAEKYFTRSQENARRLFQNPLHSSSMESRDEALNQFGGAVRVPNTILSFQGLTEKANEALCLELAVWFGWISQNEAIQIAKGQNPYLQPLAEIMWQQWWRIRQYNY